MPLWPDLGGEHTASRPKHLFDGAIRLAPRVVGLAALFALGLALAKLPLTYGAALVFGSVGLLAVLIRPSLALYPLAVAIPFGSLQELTLGGLTVGLSELLVVGMAMGWIMRAVAQRRAVLKPGLLRQPVVLVLGAYLGILVLSLLRAMNLAAALKELLKWVELLILMLFVASEINPAERRWVGVAFLLAASAEALYGVYQFLFRVGPPGFVLFGRYMRAFGTFKQPNPFGGYLGLLLPLAYTGCFVWVLDRRSAIGGGPWQRGLLGVVSLIASVCLTAGLIMSWSRGALLGAAAGVALVLTALGKRVWGALLIVTLVLLLLAPTLWTWLPTDWASRLMGSGSVSITSDLRAVEIDDENFSIVERLAHWQAAWQMFSRHPWLGVGTGQYAAVYPEVALPRWQDPLGHAHNYYLNVLAETGLLGLGVYVLLLLLAVRVAWKRAWGATGTERWLALGAVGLLGHLIAHSLVDNLYVHEMYLLVAVLLGLVLQGVPPPEGPDLGTARVAEPSSNVDEIDRWK